MRLVDDVAARLFNSVRVPAQVCAVMQKGFGPSQVVAMQGSQRFSRKTGNRASLDYRPVPCAIAPAAFVDDPAIQQLAVGVETDLSARLEGPRRSATWAVNDGERITGRSYCP